MGKTWVECRLLTFQIRAQWVSEGVSADANGSGKLLLWDKMTRACNLFVCTVQRYGPHGIGLSEVSCININTVLSEDFYFLFFYSGFSFYKFLSGE